MKGVEGTWENYFTERQRHSELLPQLGPQLRSDGHQSGLPLLPGDRVSYRLKYTKVLITQPRKDPEDTEEENLSSDEFYTRVRSVMDEFNLLPWLYLKAPGE